MCLDHAACNKVSVVEGAFCVQFACAQGLLACPPVCCNTTSTAQTWSRPRVSDHRACLLKGLQRAWYCAIPDWEALVQVWDSQSLQCLRTLEGHEDNVRVLAVGESYVFSGSWDKSIRSASPLAVCCCEMLDLCTYLCFPALREVTRWLLIQAWHDILAPQALPTLAHSDRRLLGRGLSQGRHAGVTRPVRRHWSLMCGSDLLAMPAASWLLLRFGAIPCRVWDMDTLECVRVLEGHNEAVLALAVGPSFLVSGSYDTTVRFWALDSLRCVRCALLSC